MCLARSGIPASARSSRSIWHGHNRGDLGRVSAESGPWGCRPTARHCYGAELPVSGGHHVFDTSTGIATQSAPSVRGGIISLDAEDHAYVAPGRPGRRERSDGSVFPCWLAALDNAAFSPDMKEIYLLAGAGSAVGAWKKGPPPFRRCSHRDSPPGWRYRRMAEPCFGRVVGRFMGYLDGHWRRDGADAAECGFDRRHGGEPRGQTLYASALSPNSLYIVDAATG